MAFHTLNPMWFELHGKYRKKGRGHKKRDKLTTRLFPFRTCVLLFYCQAGRVQTKQKKENISFVRCILSFFFLYLRFIELIVIGINSRLLTGFWTLSIKTTVPFKEDE